MNAPRAEQPVINTSPLPVPSSPQSPHAHQRHEPGPVLRRIALDFHRDIRQQNEGHPPEECTTTSSSTCGNRRGSLTKADLTNTVVQLKMQLAEMRTALDLSSSSLSSATTTKRDDDELPRRPDTSADSATTDDYSAPNDQEFHHERQEKSAATDVDQLAAENAELRSHAASLARSLRRANRKIRESSSEGTSLRVNLERLSAERDDYRTRHRNLEERYEVLRRERERLGRMCVELRYDRADMMNQVRRISNAVSHQEEEEQQHCWQHSKEEGENVRNQNCPAKKAELRTFLDIANLEQTTQQVTAICDRNHHSIAAEPSATTFFDEDNGNNASPGIREEIFNDSTSSIDNYEDVFSDLRKKEEKLNEEHRQAQHGSRNNTPIWEKIWKNNNSASDSSTVATSANTSWKSASTTSSSCSSTLSRGYDSLVLDRVLDEIQEKRTARLRTSRSMPKSLSTDCSSLASRSVHGGGGGNYSSSSANSNEKWPILVGGKKKHLRRHWSPFQGVFRSDCGNDAPRVRPAEIDCRSMEENAPKVFARHA
uniref:Uncharacterized protein n=1 Tax=Odontella aurita TaxID=265563 RepID=A0A7S4JM25_9STRA|mmetsp:Transcript_49368/g.148679  ORF Transcript_49368/g.148679 Transcript_49368/m.148679 type:complete len:542 (+) Transcript_49368:370-1995(+)